jgi:hypothetical protein
VHSGGQQVVHGEKIADVQRGAAAFRRELQPALHLPGALDQRLDVGELSLGELSQYLGACAVVGPGEQLSDLGQRQAHLLRGLDRAQAGDRVRPIAPLPAGARGLRHHAAALVVANRGSVEPHGGCYLPNRE